MSLPMITPDSAADDYPGLHLPAFALDSAAGDLPGPGPAGDCPGFRCRLSPWIPLPVIALNYSCRCSPWMSLPIITPDSAAGDRPGPGPAGDVQLVLDCSQARTFALDHGGIPGSGPAGDFQLVLDCSQVRTFALDVTTDDHSGFRCRRLSLVWSCRRWYSMRSCRRWSRLILDILDTFEIHPAFETFVISNPIARGRPLRVPHRGPMTSTTGTPNFYVVNNLVVLSFAAAARQLRIRYVIQKIAGHTLSWHYNY